VLELYPGERRVALTPQNVALLLKKGFKEVWVENGAGVKSQFLDQNYAAAGATLGTRDQVYSSSNILLKVRAPLTDANICHEIDLIRKGSTLVSFVYPAQNPDLVRSLKEKDVTLFAMDQIPRITRAQTFDALRYGSFSRLN
jgi:H+-translocating NAD(P) transhydrogenase